MPILYTPVDTTPGPTPRPPYEPLPLRQAIPLEIVWTGADGSRWDLTNPASPVRLMPGIRGLEAVTPERWVSDAPGLPGNRYRGHRMPPREVFLPVYVYGTGSVDWLNVRRDWDHSLSEDAEGVLSVIAYDKIRYLPCRWVKTEPGYSRDPLYAGRSPLGEYFEAAGSYWQGARRSYGWRAESPLPFFKISGGVFHITRSNIISTATMDNDGDVPAWPVWRITGEFTTAQVGIGDATIEIPFPLAEGEWLEIDTRPENQSAIDHTGAHREDDLGQAIFAPIPADTGVELSIDATGTGPGFDITATIVPLFKRAWSL